MSHVVLVRQQLWQTVRRFPATIISCLIFCCVAIYSNHQGKLAEYLLAISFFASAWFTVGQLFLESMQLSSRIAGYAIFFTIFAAVAGYIYVFTEQLPWHFCFFAIATLALVPVAPFSASTASSDRIYAFSSVLARQIIFALFTSAILFGGLVAMVLSINALFDVKHPRILVDIGAIVGSMIFSLLTLVGMPNDFKRDDLAFSVRLVTSLIGYLVIPLLMFYGAILYWYFLVLCITQSLPKGIIVYLAAGFSVSGVLIYLAIDHARIDKIATITFYQKYFFKVILVPLFLMAFSIFIRINEYGLSRARYVVLVLIFWLIFISVFAHRQKKHLSSLIYLSLACLALITALTLRWISP